MSGVQKEDQIRSWIVVRGAKSPDLAVLGAKALEGAVPKEASVHGIAVRLNTGRRCLT